MPCVLSWASKVKHTWETLQNLLPSSKKPFTSCSLYLRWRQTWGSPTKLSLISCSKEKPCTWLQKESVKYLLRMTTQQICTTRRSASLTVRSQTLCGLATTLVRFLWSTIAHALPKSLQPNIAPWLNSRKRTLRHYANKSHNCRSRSIRVYMTTTTRCYVL